MILCVTLNPAIDRTARVPRIVFGEILRPAELVALPGGKGLNVARAARILGADVSTTGVVGGHSGRWIVEELGREGLNPHFVDTGRENRTTYVVVGADGRSVIVYENGLEQPEAAFADLIARLENELLPRSEFVVIAGSLPPGVDARFMSNVVAACRAKGVLCLVDARAGSLRAGIVERPAIVKANQEEFIEAGLAPGGHDPIQVARSVVRAGAGACVVTLGERGAVACDGARSWRLTVPSQHAAHGVGAGDVFTAGLVVSLTRGRPFDEALRWGGAAAAASLSTIGAGRLDRTVMDSLLPRVQARLVS